MSCCHRFVHSDASYAICFLVTLEAAVTALPVSASGGGCEASQELQIQFWPFQKQYKSLTALEDSLIARKSRESMSTEATKIMLFKSKSRKEGMNDESMLSLHFKNYFRPHIHSKTGLV